MKNKLRKLINSCETWLVEESDGNWSIEGVAPSEDYIKGYCKCMEEILKELKDVAL